MEELVRRITLENLTDQASPEVSAESFTAEVANSSKTQESSEAVELTAENFNNEVAGYLAFSKLSKDEVLFVDENNAPVGPPVKFKDYVDIKVKASGVVIDKYLYTPGKLNEAGFPEAGIAGEWLDYAQALVQEDYPEQIVSGRLNVVADFKAAYAEQDEPELVEGIKSGAIDSYDDIVSYFLEKPVRGAEHLNRLQYVQQEVEFRSQEQSGRPAVPKTIQSEFRKLVPGLFAYESKFNAGLVSVTGARGLAQIMPKTWQEYSASQEVSLSIVEQLDVAGKIISDNYHYIVHFAEPELSQLRGQFTSQEEFEKELIVPLMVNAYNVGGPAIGLLVKEFVQKTPPEELVTGRDLFIQFRDFAQSSAKGKEFYYGPEAGKYTTAVYANAYMVEEKYHPETIIIAQN